MCLSPIAADNLSHRVQSLAAGRPKGKFQVRGGKEVTLVPGQTFYEGPNDVHTVGRNASTTEPAKFIVILLKKQGVDVLLPAE
jgi:quercetin dioxygenase-like cupin family protein